MTHLLIRSDRLAIRSDEHPTSFISGSAQTPSQAGARLAADRAAAARLADRDLQALRSAELPLRQRPGARSEAISVHQSARRAPAPGLRSNNAYPQAAQLIDNFHRLREALDEICAINAELLRRREELG